MERWSLYPALLGSFLLHAALLFSRTSDTTLAHSAPRESGRLAVQLRGEAKKADHSAGQAGQKSASHAISAVNATIQNSIVYPELARRMGYEGPVRVGVVIENGGEATLQLLSSSGFEVLDQAALAAVRSYDFGELRGSLELTFIFRLRDD